MRMNVYERSLIKTEQASSSRPQAAIHFYYDLTNKIESEAVTKFSDDSPENYRKESDISNNKGKGNVLEGKGESDTSSSSEDEEDSTSR